MNRSIIKYIVENHISPRKCFDLPAGEGEFLRALKHKFPEAQVEGYDLFAEPKDDAKKWIQKKSVNDWVFNATDSDYDLITSISGVMCFDGLENFFQRNNQALVSGGRFIVTNDNIWTIRDRIHFFLFGHPKRFAPMFHKNEGNWNCVFPQGLVKWLLKNDFEIEHVEYVHSRAEDLLFIPLAIPFFLIQSLYIFSKNSTWSYNLKKQIYAFPSLYKRHYFIVAKKK